MLHRESQEDLKREIKTHLREDVNLIDSSFDLGDVVDKYFAVLNYDIIDTKTEDLKGLYSSKLEPLSSLFLSDYNGEVKSGGFCKNFEPYLKKLYYMLEENSFFHDENMIKDQRNTLMPILNRFNKLKELYININRETIDKVEIPIDSRGEWEQILNEDNKPRYRRLYPSSLSFDKFQLKSLAALQESFDGFIPHLINAINLKNEQSHQSPKVSRFTEVDNLKSTLMAELFVTHFCRKEIGLAIKKSTFNDSKYKEYVSNEFIKYQHRTSNYVSLNLVELSDSANPDSGLIEDILLDFSNRIRILGQGGTGKTTTLEFLVFHDLKRIREGDDNAKIPVLITIGTLSKDESIIEHISKKLNVDDVRVGELLANNKLNLYIDGINEIVSKADDKRKRIRQIVSLLEDHEQIQLIISDRYEFDDYQSNMFNLPTFLLDKLTEDQVKEFVIKYCNNDEDSIKKVFKSLLDNENIHSLFLRPLMLTRAIEIIKANNELPKKEGLVIEKFIDSLLIREKDEKLDPLLRISDFKRLMSYVADYVWNEFGANQAINEIVFSQQLKEASMKFGVEYVNPGYTMRIAFELEIITRDNEMIQFFHQSYLEFFCSYYLKYDINV